MIRSAFSVLISHQGLQPKASLDADTNAADSAAFDKLNLSEGREEAIEEALAKLDKHLSTLHTALPPRSALVVFTGHGDPRRMSQLQARKSAFENAIRGGGLKEGLPAGVTWTMADGRELEEAVERAKRGLLFLCLT